MDFLEGLRLATKLTNNKNMSFFAPPREENVDYDKWCASEEASLVLGLLFKKTDSIILANLWDVEKDIHLVLQKSGFAERIEVAYHGPTAKHTRRKKHTTYRSLTTADAVVYGNYKKNDLVQELRTKAHLAMIDIIAKETDKASRFYKPLPHSSF